MSKEVIQKLLGAYGETDPWMQKVIDQIIRSEDPFSRSNEVGHFTASAFIVDPDRSSALMIHHAGLGLWLPPGGHIDKGETPAEAAKREAGEEVGLINLLLASDHIHDVDVHQIPHSERKREPAHWHADFSFLFYQDLSCGVSINEVECKGYRWVSLAELAHAKHASIARMASKAISILAKRSDR